jgi:hypothetical protein
MTLLFSAGEASSAELAGEMFLYRPLRSSLESARALKSGALNRGHD